jgi:hypothetical protein
MKTSYMFISSAVLEIITGLAFVFMPSSTVEFLLGSPLSSQAGAMVCRIAGAALIALSLAYWLARNDAHSIAARGLIAGAMLYNILALVILICCAFVFQLTVVLLSAITIHILLAAFCIYALRNPNS